MSPIASVRWGTDLLGAITPFSVRGECTHLFGHGRSSMPSIPSWLTFHSVSQLSFFSAESIPPAVTDLAGMLAGPGQVVTSEDRARISIVVDRDWRAQAVAELIAQCGLGAEVTRSEEGSPLRPNSVDARTPSAVRAMDQGSSEGGAGRVGS